MAQKFGADQDISKAQGLSDALNRLIQNIIIRCTRGDGIHNYFDVGVIAYGQQGGVGSALSGALSGRDFVTVQDLVDNPLRIEDRDARGVTDHPGGLTIKLPIWIEPIAFGLTDMCAALAKAYDLLSQWVSTHPDSYPPIVIHISDGGSTDGDPVGPAQRIMAIATSNGNALVFNCHISAKSASPVLYPNTEPRLPDRYATTLYNMSSELPPAFSGEAEKEGFATQAGARGFGFNADLVSLIQFIDIGTRAASTRLR